MQVSALLAFPMTEHLQPNPALLTWLVLRRVQRGGVKKLGGTYLDQNRPLPGHLLATVNELFTADLLALADPDPIAEATQQVITTETGLSRYVALCAQQRADLGTVAGPACRRLDVREATASSPDLHWARCPIDQRLHAFKPADQTGVGAEGYVEALCGYLLAADVLAIEGAPSGALCMGCTVDVISVSPNPGPRGSLP